MKKTLSGLAAIIAVSVGLVLALSGGASAQSPSGGMTTMGGLGMQVVDVDSLYVREGPAGIIKGTLFRGEHFNTERDSPSGLWCYGYAHGNVQKHGWVQCNGLKKVQ